MSEILFSKHEIGIYVRSEEHPTINTRLGDMATITINQIIYGGTLTKIESKKIKNDDGEEEIFVHVIMKVDTIAANNECQVMHPKPKNEITDVVTIMYDGVVTKKDDDFDFSEE